MTVPPARTSGNPGRLNSVVGLTAAAGGRLEHPEYIVYSASQSLPEYAIWYRHGAACACTHCAHVQVSMPDGSRVKLKASKHDSLETVRKLLRHANALEGVADADTHFYLAGGDAPQTGPLRDVRGKDRRALEVAGRFGCGNPQCLDPTCNERQRDELTSMRSCDGILGPPVLLCVIAVHVYVMEFSGNRIALEMGLAATIKHIKVKIEAKKGIPREQQRLIFGGRQLVDDQTLAECNIQNSTTLHLVVRN